MTILQALNDYYDRIPDIAKPGWSEEKFGWCIVLSPNGRVVDVEDLRDNTGKKPRLKTYTVPWPDRIAKRTSGVEANLFVDKSSYVLGVTDGASKRPDKEHSAFRDIHLESLVDHTDEGLRALRSFVGNWRPENFQEPLFRAQMLDDKFMFRLDGERQFLHERPAAIVLLEEHSSPDGKADRVQCLASGIVEVPARLHRDIKGVDGAQSSGAPLVSCNSKESPAFSSYGKDQGLLAPTGSRTAFRYATALNSLLVRDGGNRLRRTIGDATVVFWADVSDVSGANDDAAAATDDWFADVTEPPTDESETARIREDLRKIASGAAISSVRPEIVEGTKFHVLGLSPNAARLSVRFWLTGDFGQFATALAQHHEDLRVEPTPMGWTGPPSLGILLVRTTAAQSDFKNIPHQLAGEVMRAMLASGRYPLTLLSAAIMRLRAGDSAATGWHAAVIRAVLNRQRRKNPLEPEKGEIPMGLNRSHDNIGYQLGRLFAVYETAQRTALGKVNATIRDRFFGAASATPASVFPLIVRGGQNHLAKVRKEKPGFATLIERELEEINSHFKPSPGGIWPRSLRLPDQGEFAIGYYHQRATKLTSDEGEAIDPALAGTETEGTDA